MTIQTHSLNPYLRLFAIIAIIILALGFIFPVLGAWNGLVLSAWLIGTQKPLRGFLFVAAIAFFPALVSNWDKLSIGGIEYLGWMIAGALVSVLPYLCHRLIYPRLQGFISTFALPLWGTVFQVLGQRLLPPSIFGIFSLIETQKANVPLLQVSSILGSAGAVFLMYWFASIVNWIWDNDFEQKKVTTGAAIFGIVFFLAMGYGTFLQFNNNLIAENLSGSITFAWICLIAALGLGTWAFSRPDKYRKQWMTKSETIALLRSPYTGESLQVKNENGKEFLVSLSNERFPIQNGIPIFLKPDELTGSNKKYNQLYETIGGFYDSSQKFVGALLYGGSDYVLSSYLHSLEIKPGDSVLETSVGTGLNYRLLPKDIKRFGLDLSAEMLANCQANLRRWDMDADLFQGNAESLPFDDNSMDVVYHAGGINFFNDKKKAIREMIRVAKPGSLILIADETEKHAQDTYERMPITSGYFKDRDETISAPINIVPPEMLDIKLELVWQNRFYALTFRKPVS